MWIELKEKKPIIWKSYDVVTKDKIKGNAFWNGEIGFTDSDGEKLIPFYDEITHWFDTSYYELP